MEYTTDCMQCGKPLEGKRRGALFCKDRCRKRFDRWQKKAVSDGYDPPVSRTSSINESRADDTFRRQLASAATRTLPLTDEERILLARQKRNPGPLMPELAKIQLDRAVELQQREIAEAARANPLRVQDQLDPTTYGHLARRAILSRSRQSKPQDPNLRVLRPPVEPGHGPWDEEPQCIQAPWSRPR